MPTGVLETIAQKSEEYQGLMRLKLEQVNRFWINGETDHASMGMIAVKNLMGLMQTPEDVQ